MDFIGFSKCINGLIQKYISHVYHIWLINHLLNAISTLSNLLCRSISGRQLWPKHTKRET